MIAAQSGLRPHFNLTDLFGCKNVKNKMTDHSEVDDSEYVRLDTPKKDDIMYSEEIPKQLGLRRHRSSLMMPER